ncbi:LacI family DNA-binding transcriptional regulator [Rathayibacter tanaceti]|uniref:HTH-type transcriptional repressor CytR n=2 Tax=Rathayibacter tanaceti TaxID=1671680 RepID=A0A162GHC7_9MICO|nr:substrate-binding domain-containing protein [Rathayibacter tanaceti]KZX21159.1 HTH-type transcriptional repressor CytR [Rathayibacter tanaceti]QHC54244.1 substrate-binding domain-containing protein [Rathayibacter tanaceti]TCO37920.1 DNA-binding LacI/PurR family transcriptional regulator [Rathayibacter tanaceti]
MEPHKSPRPTLARVASRAGVSPSTASLVFSGAGPVSDATKERVLRAAAELDYAGPDPRARSLRRGRSGIVGVVVDERVLHAFRDPIKIAMLDGIADVLGGIDAGILLLTETGDGSGLLATAPVDATILVACSPSIDDSVALLRRRGVPVVVVEGASVLGGAVVSLDNRAASRTVAEHLRELGHERVGVVSLPFAKDRRRGPIPAEWRSSPSITPVDRLLGVQDVFPDGRVVAAAASTVEEGIVAGRALLDAARAPTAIVAQSDLLAAGVILAAEERGLRVPQDVSVVGFDGVQVPGLAAEYDLTTMAQPAVEKGRAAGRAAIALLAGEEAETVCFRATFHRGNTSAPPR